MARSTRSPRRTTAAASSTAVHESGRATDPVQDGWQRTLDISRTMFGATLGASQEWMRGLGDFQQAQAAVLRHAGESIDDIASQAERAPDWPSLWALQASLAGMQWACAAEDCNELIEQAMQIEARFVERCRADVTRLSQHWLGEARVPVEAGDVAEVATPMAMLNQAQAAMSEVSRLWTQALYHTALPE